MPRRVHAPRSCTGGGAGGGYTARGRRGGRSVHHCIQEGGEREGHGGLALLMLEPQGPGPGLNTWCWASRLGVEGRFARSLAAGSGMTPSAIAPSVASLYLLVYPHYILKQHPGFGPHVDHTLLYRCPGSSATCEVSTAHGPMGVVGYRCRLSAERGKRSAAGAQLDCRMDCPRRLPAHLAVQCKRKSTRSI